MNKSNYLLSLIKYILLNYNITIFKLNLKKEKLNFLSIINIGFNNKLN